MIVVAQHVQDLQPTAMQKAFAPQTMTEIVSHITAPMTDVEEALFNQRGMKEVYSKVVFESKTIHFFPAPFRDLDRSGRAVCQKNKIGKCPFGHTCPLRHIVGEKAVVCKHWLRGLCKKGDQCEFLHEYDLTKMPECFFFSKYSACSNRECPFRHIDPETKMKDCPWYDRGFCRHGPYCKHRHRRRAICPNYLAGFCPQGPDCQYAHPSFSLPSFENTPITHHKPTYSQVTCHNCHERGHKATTCPTLPGQNRGSHEQSHRVDLSLIPDKKNLSDVTCYKVSSIFSFSNFTQTIFSAERKVTTQTDVTKEPSPFSRTLLIWHTNNVKKTKKNRVDSSTCYGRSSKSGLSSKLLPSKACLHETCCSLQ